MGRYDIRPRLSECVQNMYKYEPYMWYDIKYMTAEKIKGADFTHRIKFVLLVY